MSGGDFVNGNGAPGWVKAVSTLGLATVLSLGGAYFVGGVVKSQLDKSLSNDADFRLEHEAIRGMVTAHIDATGRANSEILFYLRALCIQGASNAGTNPRDCVYRGGEP